MITADQITGVIVGLILGILVAGAAVYKYVKTSISPTEAMEIYGKAMSVMNNYNNAMAHGPLTTEEKLKIAEETLSTLQTVIKALEA